MYPQLKKDMFARQSDFPLKSPIYLDCNGSTPVEPEILQRFDEYIRDPAYWGNYSANHARHLRNALAQARAQMAEWVGGAVDGVFFCASATEANNLAIQGLLAHGLATGKRHIIITEIEHDSIHKICEYLVQQHGFTLSRVAPEPDGRVCVAAIIAQLRPETLLVCCMQANNETGVIQPVAKLAQALQELSHEAYLHVDAVQGVAHIDEALFPDASLRHPRIDMLTVSGHKMYGICGIAALLIKTRPSHISASDCRDDLRHSANSHCYPPLRPILFGGGQQGNKELPGLRSGSLPLALALSLRDAWELCEAQRAQRQKHNQEFRQEFWKLLQPLNPQLNGGIEYILPHVCNVTFPGINAESALLNLRNLLVASQGSSCQNNSTRARSGTLAAMGLNVEAQNSSLRFSWWHQSPRFWQEGPYENWGKILIDKLQKLKIS